MNTGISTYAANSLVYNYGISSSAAGNGANNIGGKFYAYGIGAGTVNYGINSIVELGTTNYAGYFEANGISGSSGSRTSNYGGYFLANSGNLYTSNYGIKTIANCPSGWPLGVYNYGIWAEVNNNNINSWAGWFEGNVYINGDIDGAGTFNYVSDRMFKTNIDSLHNALNIINQLKPRSFYFDTTNVYGLHFNSSKQYGLIAQDVVNVLPELVSQTVKPADLDSIGNIIHPSITYKNLNYNAFFAILLKGMQEQQMQIKAKDSANALLNKRIDSLKNAYNTRFDSIEAMISRCCGMDTKTAPPSNNRMGYITTPNNIQYVKLSNENAIILNQNDPNPFAEETDITYFLPETAGISTMMFYDNTGVIIKAVELQSKGNGTLHVYASDLSSGIYTYALIVDGKLIDSKKMMKTK